jgi:hypothetical protein
VLAAAVSAGLAATTTATAEPNKFGLEFRYLIANCFVWVY